MKPLSITQQNALESAHYKLERDQKDQHIGFGQDDGWFSPQFTQVGSIEFACRPQTARSLFDLGLLDNRTVGDPFWDERGRKWRYAVEYRISHQGIEFLVQSTPLDWKTCEDNYGQHG